MPNRRELTLATAAALAIAPWVSAGAQSAPPTAEDARLTALLDVFFREGLRQNPEGATQLGLDTGANADLRSKIAG